MTPKRLEPHSVLDDADLDGDGVVTNGESPVPEGACNGAWRNGRGTAVLRGDVPWDGGAAW